MPVECRHYVAMNHERVVPEDEGVNPAPANVSVPCPFSHQNSMCLYGSSITA